MVETETPHFYDFGTFERVPGTQHQLFLSLETPGYLKQIKNPPGDFNKYYLYYKSPNLGNPGFVNFGKDVRRNIEKIRLIRS